MRGLTQNDETQLAADVAIIQIVNRYLNRYNRGVKKKAVNLMQYVKKEYNLADD